MCPRKVCCMVPMLKHNQNKEVSLYLYPAKDSTFLPHFVTMLNTQTNFSIKYKCILSHTHSKLETLTLVLNFQTHMTSLDGYCWPCQALACSGTRIESMIHAAGQAFSKWNFVHLIATMNCVPILNCCLSNLSPSVHVCARVRVVCVCVCVCWSIEPSPMSTKFMASTT